MAMKKDDDKTKKVASPKKKDSLGSPTASGKPAYKIGGDNPLGVRKLNASKPTASTSSGPRAVPSRPMGRDVTGEANFDRTPRTRATVSVGPATLSMGGKTSKSTGGMDMSKGTVKPKSSVNPAAKMNILSKKPYAQPSTQSQQEANDAFIDKRNRRQMRTAVGATALGTGIGLNFMGGENRIKQAAKYIGNTKERRAKKAEKKAEEAAMIVERKAKQPSILLGKNSKISKSTMKNINRLKKGK
jgi:hypothetical protein